MFRNYFRIAWRNLIKDRQFTLLNLIGLSTGLACTIAIYLWVSDEMHINKFNEKDSQLFQVMKNAEAPDGIKTDERTPGLLASSLALEMPEVEYATAVIPVSWFDKKGYLSRKGLQIAANGQFAGQDYFKIFPYRLIEGNKDQVLHDKQSIVISKELALKLFHATEHVVGKYVEWNQRDYNGVYMISGVFETPPANAGSQFDIVFNYALFLEKNAKLQRWGNNDPSTYVVLKKGTDIASFNRKLTQFITDKRGNSKVGLFVQQYADTYLHNQYENGAPVGGRAEYVKLFSIIAIFILIIACINFMNLSTAKAAARMKEVGIKKIMGASRGVLAIQYLGESLLLSFLAVVVAIGLVMLLLPQFNQITGKQLHLRTDPGFMLAIVHYTPDRNYLRQLPGIIPVRVQACCDTEKQEQ